MALLVLLLLVNACKKQNEAIKKNPEFSDGYDWKNHLPFEADYPTFQMPYSTRYKPIPLENGLVYLSEASGIASSIRNKGFIWAHNDSGHPAKIYLIHSQTGEIVVNFSITGLHNIDWEDMEIAVSPHDSLPYLYIADAGDNDEKRPEYQIYRFQEPVYDSASMYGSTQQLSNHAVEEIRFHYPDGSHDTEGIMVEPKTGNIYLVTKRDERSMLFVLPFPQKLTDAHCYVAGYFPFKGASAASSNYDGSRILIKDRQSIFYWENPMKRPFYSILSETPVKLPYVGEPQGEAACFDLNNNYFTLSEALNQQTFPILYQYLQ